MLEIIINLGLLVLFIILIWPQVKKEHWREKFLENKHAKSLLIVFTLILFMTVGVSLFFDIFFPVERLDQ